MKRIEISPKEAHTFIKYAIRDEYIKLTDPDVRWSDGHDLVSFDMRHHRIVFINRNGLIGGIYSMETLDGKRLTHKFLGKDLMEYFGSSVDLQKLQSLLERAT